VTLSPRSVARRIRYALPALAGRAIPTPDAGWVVRKCDALAEDGLAAAIGYFQADDAGPETVAQENLAAIARLSGGRRDAYFSLKAPPLGFDAVRISTIAQAAREAGMAVVFDSHAPDLADPTLALVERLLPDYPGTGFALPARWRRSVADAHAFRDSTARIRLVKGEWPDPEGDDGDPAERYLALARILAGRPAKVAVATHDPALAERALAILLAQGTPCELEQLRGLPRARTCAVARRLGVPIRLYLPFGPGWWPYAVDRALARPYLLGWMLRDRLGAAQGRSSRRPSIGNAGSV